MDPRDRRGQILIEALVGTLVLTILFLTILNQLQFIQKRTRHEGLSQERSFQFQKQHFGKE